jgi:hypothetical protein
MFGLLTLSGILEIDLFNGLENAIAASITDSIYKYIRVISKPITKDRADKIGHTNRSANFCPTALYF